jgi:hypothetical protein
LKSNTNVDYYENNQAIVLDATDKLIFELKDSKDLEVR